MNQNEIQKKIEDLVKSEPVVLYMKGSKLFPRCGFSMSAVSILDQLGVEFQAVDVLSDPDIRQGIKSYSGWPTIPQLYVNGEFVGGCDIMKEMLDSGELAALLSEFKK